MGGNSLWWDDSVNFQNIGDFCLVDYQMVGGPKYVGTTGIVIPAENWGRAGNICLPPDAWEQEIVREIEDSARGMADWLLISKNAIINQLNLQTTSIVSQIGSSGGGGGNGGGITDQQYNALILSLNAINSTTTQTKGILTTGISNILADIDQLALDMILEFDFIMQELTTGSTGLGDILLDGIDSIVTWIGDQLADIVNGFLDFAGDLFAWSDGMLAAIADSFKAQAANLVDTVTNFTAFITDSMFAGFNVLLDGILAPLSLLGDVADFLGIDFLGWLNEVSDWDVSQVEDKYKQILEMVKSSMATIDNFAGEKGG